jgi:hypothetical protein
MDKGSCGEPLGFEVMVGPVQQTVVRSARWPENGLIQLADGHAERSVGLPKRRRIESIGEAHQTGHFFLGDLGRRAPAPPACHG